MAALIKEYFLWHYTRALADIFGVWMNFLWFGYHFFSIKLLFKTLFSPFYRIKETTTKFDMELIMENIVANTISRVIGFIMRSFVLAAGTAYLFLTLFLIVPVLVAWFFLPLVVPAIFLAGMTLVFY